MNTRFLCASAAAFFMLAAGGDARAEGATLAHYRTNGDEASAEFFSEDVETCPAGIVTRVVVVADAFQGKWNGLPVDQGHTLLLLTVFDNCEHALVMSLVAQTSHQNLEITQNLGLATLTTDRPFFDEISQSFVDVAIDLVWEGWGRITRQSLSATENFENLTFIKKTSGIARRAVATGSVIVDGINRTPSPAFEAGIDKDSFHELTVIRH